ncbi:carbonic anhydrase [Flavobacterium nackdongense]|uniref:Carbonic anhydrase n=1 Tax=Flavobacterium nackdongense TaxID=2547394 RepID=A0A4P6Y5W7_9FLAO|nr:carbonic anhydrase [Flavobacterium nackdongense]QBN17601.1 carbonic anhydrase [Flavobacterium nackdongense]
MKKSLLYGLLISVFISCTQTKTNDESKFSPLQKLQEGNKRFAAGKPVHPDETLERLRELKKGQHPFAIVVSCSDSRVPAELVFDQGLGDIFSIRTAGNVMGDYELGSIEYAVEHLDCKLVVVMGHKDCGAIKAFIKSEGHYEHFDHIKKIIEYIESEQEEKNLESHLELHLDKAIDANIEHGLTYLKGSEPILKAFYDSKKVKIIGALYDIETGKVTFDTNTKI